MRTYLNEQKATAMAAYFLQKAGGEMEYIKLIKLLYIADREALKRWGRPLTGDAYYSLPHGPIVSRIKDFITDDPELSGAKVWKDFIETEPQKYSVRLKREVPWNSLADAEVELLEEIFKKYGRLTKWEIVELTHRFSEWKDPGGSALEITYEDILRAVGRADEAEELAKEIEDHNFAKALLEE